MSYFSNSLFLSQRNILLLIFFVAFAWRLIAVINLANEFKTPGADAAQYDILATNLLAGKGYIDSNNLPTSFQVPLYPIFLAFIYLNFGIKNYFAVRFIQCIMGALLCIIIFYIGLIAFNRKTGLLAATVLVFYQPFIFYSCYGGPTFLLSENLFIFLLSFTVLFLIRNLFVRFTLKNSIIAGILIGAVILTRAVFAPFVLFLFALLMSKNKYSFLLTLKKTLPLFIVIALIILPWTVRNCIVHRAFVPFSTEGGFALFSGNNPYAKGGGQTNLEGLLSEDEREHLAKISEVQRDKMLGNLAVNFLLKNYKKVPELVLRKLIVLWDIFGIDYSGVSLKRKYNIWYAIVLMFSLAGITKSLRAKLNINHLLFISLFIYFSVIAMIFAGDPRIRYPLEPYLIIFASAGIFAIYDVFKNKSLAYALISIIISINLIFYLKSELFLGWIRNLRWLI